MNGAIYYPKNVEFHSGLSILSHKSAVQPRTFTIRKGLGKHNEAIYRKRVVYKVPRSFVALLINCSLANKSKGRSFMAYNTQNSRDKHF